MIGETAFPGGVDSLSTLLRLGLGTTTELLQDIWENSTEIRVGNPALLSSPDGVIQVENEYITYSAISGDTLTVETRGAFQDEGGYPAAAHRNGVRVTQTMLPSHHRVLADAIAETQGKLGTGASTPDTDAYLVGTGSGPSAWKELFAPAVLSLPTAGISHRGKVKRVDGATGVADRLAIQRKNAGDIHEWADIPTLVGPARGVLPVFNLKDMGAKGDGTTDDTAASNRAVAAANNAGGGIVYFPPGTYRLGSQILVSSTESNVHFLGAGRDLTIVKVMDGVGATVFNIAGDFCSVRHLTADGNRQNPPGSGITGNHAIRIQGVGHTIEHVRVKNSHQYGLGCGQGDELIDFLVRDVIIENAGADGIDTKNPLLNNRNIVYDNVDVHNFGLNLQGQKAGIDCRGPIRLSNISILVDTTIGNDDVGIRFRQDNPNPPNEPGARRANLSGAVIVMPTDHPSLRAVHVCTDNVGLSNIAVNGSNFGILSSVIVEATGEQAAWTNLRVEGAANRGFTPVAGVTLSNCHAVDCLEGFELADDVQLIGFSCRDCTTGVDVQGDRATLLGGKFYGSSGTAISVAAAADATQIAHVDVSQFSGTALSNSGTNTTIRDSPGLTTLPSLTESRTIASGAITIVSTANPLLLTVDTEAGDPTDDLTTINGGFEGQVLIVRTASGARDVTLVDGANLNMEGSMTLDTNVDSVMLYCSTAGVWRQLARSNNA